MEIDLKGIVIIVGNYGSGKSEVAINLAANRSRAGLAVRLGDLDLVNPYFRSREARRYLAGLGVDVVLPPEQYLHADLPILSPAIAGMLRRPSALTLLDVGGDEVGATVLGALGDALKGQPVKMLQVVNPFRPYTDTLDGCLKMRDAIAKRARMPLHGWIGNAHLMGETGREHIYQGHDFVRELALHSGQPLVLTTAPTYLMAKLDLMRFTCPVLAIDRQLLTPWQRQAAPPPSG